ncbi:MAG: signal recognition particle-docking protein FtsY [Clostridia bacterium]|nr:signal recognition particle-docking protein FtsY [Clostridia bacterium]
MGFFSKLVAGLKKTRTAFTHASDRLFRAFSGELGEDFYEELEEIFLLADFGVPTATALTEQLREIIVERRILRAEDAREALKDLLCRTLGEGERALELKTKPALVLVIGVNGVGKTTSIGKIANCLREEGRKVALVAADTFRAAAIEQLSTWAQRSGTTLIAQKEGADPASVVYDAIDAARHGRADTLIVDTAGRLQNKKNLMDELAKIFRVIDRELPSADREVLLVLDATMGQNAVSQAREFTKAAPITGIVLTKIDGSAKGGIVFALKKELGIGVRYIGVGEGMDDLQLFEPRDFVEALFSGEEGEQ